MGKITRMQILYPLMHWKPHSCILNMKDNFDTKCKAWFKRSSSAQVTLPTEAWGYWNQWGVIGIQSEPLGVSITKKYLHMINKCHSIWKWATRKTRFRHNSCIGVYGKYNQNSYPKGHIAVPTEFKTRNQRLRTPFSR